MPMRYRWSRQKGAHVPYYAVSVIRPHAYSNPFEVVHQRKVLDHLSGKTYRQKYKNPQLNEVAVLLFEACYEHDLAYRAMIRRDLYGKDLKCFCPLEWPCHADVLLRWAAHDP